MRSIFLLFFLYLTIGIEASELNFTCPDEQAHKLFERVQELAKVSPLDQAESGYAIVIQQAGRRSMDDLSLRLACKALATKTLRSKCSDYGYECPHPGSDLMEWPAQINHWIPTLKANVPALRSCPDAYIHEDPKLPIVRAIPVLSADIVNGRITGWVTLRVDIDETGNVTDARVDSSTSPRLHESALEAVRRFRYQATLRDSKYVASSNVSATVYFHYWHLAEAAGCLVGHE